MIEEGIGILISLPLIFMGFFMENTYGMNRFVFFLLIACLVVGIIIWKEIRKRNKT